MAKHSRNLAGILAVIGTMAASMAWAEDGHIPAPSAQSRVRSSASRLVAMMRDARERSTTFRALADTIETTNGIVYVEHGPCEHGVKACLVSITAAGANRLVSVKVNFRTVGLDLPALVGHELRHAVEVLADPDVTSVDAMYSFYARHGRRPLAGGFETVAAQEAGRAVRREMGHSRIR